MNNHIRIFLPLTLLLSTMAYTMDKTKHEDEQTIFDVPVDSPTIQALVAEKAVTKPTLVDNAALMITPESSTILASPVIQPNKKEESSSSSSSSTSSMSNSSSSPIASAPISTSAQSKKLGFLTGFKDSWYGQSVQVNYEIANDKFDPAIPANNRRLSKALEDLANNLTHENAALAHDILTNCIAKKIVITDLKVLELLRKSSVGGRTGEEKQLTSTSTVALQNADKGRSTARTEFDKACVAVIENVKAIDKKASEELDAAHKKHDSKILLYTQIKRLTREVTPTKDFIKADGYDSDPESKCDRQGNAHRLGLDVLAANTHKLNNRFTDNTEVLRTTAAEHVEKKAFKLNVSQVADE
jgi:hypothetical protein